MKKQMMQGKVSYLCTFFLCVALMISSGCAKNPVADWPSERENHNVTEQTREVALRIHLDARPSLKSYPEDEREIKKQYHNFNGLRAVLYTLTPESKPDAVAYVFDLDVRAKRGVYSGRDYDPMSDPLDQLVITQNLQLRCDNYHLYVIATPTREIKQATEVGKSFDELQASMSTEEWYDNSKQKIQYHTYINPEAVVLDKAQMEQTALTQVYYTPEVVLKSVAAYVSIDWKPVIKNPKFQVSSTNICFAPDVVNKKFFLLPSGDNEVEEKANIFFPIDPNYTNLAGKTVEELALEFNYIPPFTKEMEPVHSLPMWSYSHYTQNDDDFVIIPENTSSYEDAIGTKVSRIIIGVRVYPIELYSSELESIKETDVDAFKKLSWLRYKDKYYSMNQWLTKLKEIKAKMGSTSPQNVLTPEEEAIWNCTQTHLATAIEESSHHSMRRSGLHAEDVDYYYMGRVYYAIPISHLAPEVINQHPKLPGAYAVVRNTHYKINIKSFATIGVPSPEYISRDIDYNTLRRAKLGTVTISTPTDRTIEIDELQ